MTEEQPRPQPHQHEFEPLRWIGAYKLLKAALAVIGGIVVLKLVHVDLPAVTRHWMDRLDIDPESRAGIFLLKKVSAIRTSRIHLLAYWLFGYVPIGIAEGIGLMRRLFWAEWLTVITTAALIPFEIREVWRHATWARALVLGLNVLVVLYLIVRIRRDQRLRRLRHSLMTDALTHDPPAAEEQTRREQHQDSTGGRLGHRIDRNRVQ